MVEFKYFRYKETECKLYLSKVSRGDDAANLYECDYILQMTVVERCETELIGR